MTPKFGVLRTLRTKCGASPSVLDHELTDFVLSDRQWPNYRSGSSGRIGLKQRRIGTEHFLLALSSVTNDDPARMILTRLGIDLELLRQQVLATLN